MPRKMARTALSSSFVDTLRSRALEKGGFAMFHGGSYRVDATAWAVLATASTGSVGLGRDMIDAGRARLAASQSEDGRVSISSSEPGSFWPTPLAILAWHGAQRHAKNRSHARDFLLGTSGKHWAKRSDSIIAHDPSIRGWPWTQDTHSWVEPTSLSILALRVMGDGEHDRVREGIRMLMDRQLPSGGWNYGNTFVYGTEQYPQADCTGIALNALAGEVPKSEVEKSVRYLQVQVTRIRTPRSLGWGVLGLGAGGKRPDQATAWIAECLSRQNIYGEYDTTLVSLLLLALEGKGGIVSLFRRMKEGNS
jgi:hypothetical protein